MATRSGDENMMQDSIEAKVDGDVEMQDAPENTNGTTRDASGEADTSAVQTDGATSVQDAADDDGEADADGEVDADGEADADGEIDDEEEEVAETSISRPGRKRGPDTPLRRLLTLIDATQKYLSEFEEDGEPLAQSFQRLPRKNDLRDYYDVIAKPMAFSTVRSKILKKGYSTFSQFVEDVAQICHNAQVYNRPSAPVFGEAVRLREIFEQKLKELVDEGTIKAEEAVLPDLGELPPVEDSPPPGEMDEDEDDEMDEDDEDEDEDEDEEDDDSDDEGGRRRGRKRGRPSKKDEDDDYVKKRGRPPKVLTPTEARIDAILKGLRKPRNEDGDLRVFPFEKLPDKQLNKDYYTVIENPIALDQIKRNAKRKKYRNVDSLLADLDLMFENAMRYNEEGSDIYDDAVELQKEARRLADQERSKSDEVFRDEEGKLPLSEVVHNGQLWKVGDWVHIRNPNDLQKPIVAQIYRLWQDEQGKKWINACWYYRPEQTVHRVSKRFYRNEVMKTGRYRDHLVDDIVDRCFVMFHTRYHKGRPRGFPPDKEVYVCEARYNEEKYTFNRIKTWTSCLPDEVRERDYEMDLFQIPRKLSKEPTPIAHLLAHNAKPTDPLPKPNWGHKDAPPIIGAVHMRPREPNDSPSPEPTAPELATVPPPSMVADPIRRQSMPMPPGPNAFHHPSASGPAPSPSSTHSQLSHQFQQPHFAPQHPQGRSFAHTPVPPSPYQQHAHQQHAHQHQHQHQQLPHHHSQHHQVHSPALVGHSAHYTQQQQHPSYHHPQQQSQFAPVPASAAHHHHIPSNSFHSTPFSHPQASPLHHHQSRHPMAPAQNNAVIPHANANAYIPPRMAEVYTLRDLDPQIPAEIREQYQTDDKGQILFFTAPPLNRPHQGVAEENAALGHSVRFLSGLQEHREKRKRLREERDEAEKGAREEKLLREKELRENSEKELGATAGRLLGDWIVGIQRGNEVLEKDIASFRAEKAAYDAEKAGTKATTNGHSASA